MKHFFVARFLYAEVTLAGNLRRILDISAQSKTFISVIDPSEPLSHFH